jgi:Mg2+ and Co2+ transporter CorA
MLVNSVAYRDGKKIADITRDEISTYLDRNDCIVWVAVRDPEPHELDLLEDEFKLHPLAIEDARHGHQRPKFEEYGDSLFFVMHMIEPDGDELRVGMGGNRLGVVLAPSAETDETEANGRTGHGNSLAGRIQLRAER